MSLGDIIKEKRKRAKLTQPELADEIGVSLTTLRRWEGGKTKPDSDNILLMSKVLNTSAADLLGETDDSLKPGTSQSVDKAVALPESNVRFVDVTWVPVVDGAITVCCGAGTAYAEDVEWNVVGKYPVPTADLMGFSWALKDGGFRIITVEGDSMAPRIEDGDQVLFADMELLNGDLGLVRYRGRYMIRGVFFEGNNIRLQAINKEYDPIIVLPENLEEFCILGKVLGKALGFEKLNGLW